MLFLSVIRGASAGRSVETEWPNFSRNLYPSDDPLSFICESPPQAMMILGAE